MDEPYVSCVLPPGVYLGPPLNACPGDIVIFRTDGSAEPLGVLKRFGADQVSTLPAVVCELLGLRVKQPLVPGVPSPVSRPIVSFTDRGAMYTLLEETGATWRICVCVDCGAHFELRRSNLRVVRCSACRKRRRGRRA